MNTISPQAIRRAAATAALLFTLPLVAACSGGGDEDPTTAASDAGTAAPTTLATSTLEASDAYCELAIAAQPVGEDIANRTGQMSEIIGTALATGDIGPINQWGNDLATPVSQMLDFYTQAQQYVEGDPIAPQFTLMESFERDYSLELARLAATAVDTSSFTGAVGELATRDAILTLINQAPDAASQIKAYTDERCGATS